ncbi:3'-5' exonuclease [Iodobacter sp. CM08]|uniref:3'-5' exonuclease n=1 Tax=Iodobacter sp. CM08 TaxID=3085902 RepID=UPI0029818C5B|nr:3'-5' exonuclease [Iodobacter sp. CM08]MDW5418921.1 3'-5' exonuclease [Iodobacter sp. CM08]
MKTLFLDLETTGLNKDGTDEILEIAIIDNHGQVLMNTLVKPVIHTEWPEAQAIHGISPEMVTNAPKLDELQWKILDLIVEHETDEIVIYNAAYDWAFMPTEIQGISIYLEIKCAMTQFAEYNGLWNVERNCWKWQKLSVAAEHFNHVWNSEAHRALADTLALKTVWEGMASWRLEKEHASE